MTALINIRRLLVGISVMIQLIRLWPKAFQVLEEVVRATTTVLAKCNHTKTKPVGQHHLIKDKWKRMKTS